MITLHPIISVNPFEAHPGLKTIWPEVSQRVAEEYTAETLEAIAKGFRVGGLYLIVKSDLSRGFVPKIGNPAELVQLEKNQQVVGITGYFFVDKQDEPYLRWHGIIPEHRGKGYSYQALDLVVAAIRAEVPGAKGLTELIPNSPGQSQLERHFATYGFKPCGPTETYEWSPYTWQPVRLALRRNWGVVHRRSQKILLAGALACAAVLVLAAI